MEKDLASDLKGIIAQNINADCLPTYICTAVEHVISSPTACHKGQYTNIQSLRHNIMPNDRYQMYSELDFKHKSTWSKMWH